MNQTHEFDRNARAVVMRNGIVTALAGNRADVGELTNIPVLNMTGVAVGASVLILLDRDSAVIVGAYAP